MGKTAMCREFCGHFSAPGRLFADRVVLLDEALAGEAEVERSAVGDVPKSDGLQPMMSKLLILDWLGLDLTVGKPSSSSWCHVWACVAHFPGMIGGDKLLRCLSTSLAASLALLSAGGLQVHRDGSRQAQVCVQRDLQENR